MSKGFIFTLLIFLFLTVSTPSGYCQRRVEPPRPNLQTIDIETRERIFFENKRFLRRILRRGLNASIVQRVLGEPEIVIRANGVEIWGYDGMEVRIEFVNGRATRWFFRFMETNRGANR
jgi:hypothetical protein